jgi:hypothetical protein
MLDFKKEPTPPINRKILLPKLHGRRKKVSALISLPTSERTQCEDSG